VASNIINDNSSANNQVLMRRDKDATGSAAPPCNCVVTGAKGIVQKVNGKLIASDTLDMGASE